jgi:hypothetical protein
MPLVRRCYQHPLLSKAVDEFGKEIQVVAAGHPTRDAREFECNTWLEERADAGPEDGAKGEG